MFTRYRRMVSASVWMMLAACLITAVTAPEVVPVEFAKTTPQAIELKLPFKAQPKATYVDEETWCRGRYPVVWVYEVREKAKEIDRSLVKLNGLGKGGEANLGSPMDVTWNRRYMREIDGVGQQVIVFAGRRERVQEQGAIFWKSFDPSSYTTVVVREEALMHLPITGRWVPKAFDPSPLPNSIVLPLSFLRGVYPKQFTRQPTPAVGSMQYWLVYWLDIPLKRALSIAERELASTTTVVAANGGRSFRPKGRSSYVWVDLEPSNTGGTRVAVSLAVRERDAMRIWKTDRYPGYIRFMPAR